MIFRHGYTNCCPYQSVNDVDDQDKDSVSFTKKMPLHLNQIEDNRMNNKAQFLVLDNHLK